MFEDVLRVVYALCDRERMDTLFVLNLLLSLFILKCVRNSHERCWNHFCEPKNVLKALVAVPTSKASQNVAANCQRLTFHEPSLCNILILLHFFATCSDQFQTALLFLYTNMLRACLASVLIPHFTSAVSSKHPNAIIYATCLYCTCLNRGNVFLRGILKWKWWEEMLKNSQTCFNYAEIVRLDGGHQVIGLMGVFNFIVNPYSSIIQYYSSNSFWQIYGDISEFLVC